MTAFVMLFGRAGTNRLAQRFMEGAQVGTHEPAKLFVHTGADRVATALGFGVSNTAQAYADTQVKAQMNSAFQGAATVGATLFRHSQFGMLYERMVGPRQS